MAGKITIGIPTLNAPGILQRALESIIEHTSLDGDVRAVVCDDGSSEDMLNLTKQVIQHCSGRMPSLELLCNGARCGISKTWNRLARQYPSSEIIVLINDDVEVVRHWLDVLVWNLDNNAGIGMIGLNTYIALTRGQHAQIYDSARLVCAALLEVAPAAVKEFVARMDIELIATKAHERIPIVDYNEARLLDNDGALISTQGSCFAFRKSDFDRVGGFDERYFVFCEEVDFAVTLRTKLGLYPFIASYPLVFHQGGATNSNPLNLNAGEHMPRSKRLFEEKWGKTLGQLRDEFEASYARPRLKEWSTQKANWK